MTLLGELWKRMKWPEDGAFAVNGNPLALPRYELDLGRYLTRELGPGYRGLDEHRKTGRFLDALKKYGEKITDRPVDMRVVDYRPEGFEGLCDPKDNKIRIYGENSPAEVREVGLHEIGELATGCEAPHLGPNGIQTQTWRILRDIGDKEAATMAYRDLDRVVEKPVYKQIFEKLGYTGWKDLASAAYNVRGSNYRSGWLPYVMFMDGWNGFKDGLDKTLHWPDIVNLFTGIGNTEENSQRYKRWDEERARAGTAAQPAAAGAAV